ncbi:MAG: DNA mismatch repair endonuclease MutL [Lachnospiraceae bacterium]|nr:DNA mismatch repair endonuclease MutL [Lachnospiraceae bacterium]
MQINILDNQTIDKIAAGEVVERPASVVKELVENAIDSGADAITVEIKDGGISFIRVTDNGDGIEKSQIRNAFLRHATSKILSADDLTDLVSLGFRGEALASIAAVSMVETISKTKEELTGIRYIIEGGVEKEAEEIGAPNGTTVLVRNLFYNTPARKKFLKQPQTEGSYVADLMEHLALSHPQISFHFIINNQNRFHTSGGNDLKEIIYRIYGKDITKELKEIHESGDGFSINGFLGKPVINRSNRNYELFYINGRFIKSNLISKAIEAGYKEYLMQHKFPFCVLHFTIDTKRIDVNVHPAKMDVRIAGGQEFYEQVSAIIYECLHKQEFIPEMTLAQPAPVSPKPKASVKTSVPEPFEAKRIAAEKTMMRQELSKEPSKEMPIEASNEMPPSKEPLKEMPINPSKESLKEPLVPSPTAISLNEPVRYTAQMTSSGQAKLPGQASLATPVQADRIVAKQPASVQADEAITKQLTSVQADEIIIKQPTSVQADETIAKQPAPVQADEAIPKQPPLAGQIPSAPKIEQYNLFDDKLLSAKAREHYEIIGQLFDTYWLVSYQDKLMIIDQHAAHEKVKYERFLKQFHENHILSQNLNPPIVITLSGKEKACLMQNIAHFTALGFVLEEFGGNDYALSSVPLDLFGYGEADFFYEILDELMAENVTKTPDGIRMKIATAACKAAVKGNMKLTRAEASALIDELLSLENPYNCPHGRPTIISMSKYELEKKFKRIV